MRGKWFYVFWYDGNDPNERGFYVNADNLAQVWDAIENTYGEEDAEYYDVIEEKRYTCPKGWAYIRNGRFDWGNDE